MTWHRIHAGLVPEPARRTGLRAHDVCSQWCDRPRAPGSPFCAECSAEVSVKIRKALDAMRDVTRETV